VQRTPGPAEAAAARLARLPWRRLPPQRDLPPPRKRGWLGGIGEARILLEELTGMAPERGRGLGGSLPWVRLADAVVACGVPVAVGSTEIQGPDGAYRLAGSSVLREAAGLEGEILRLEDREDRGEEPDFDLLWFGAAERYLVRHGRVEIEDLFARVVAPAERDWLEVALIRRRRLDPGILEGLDPEETGGPALIEVRRPEELTGAGWDDPRRLIGVRESVASVEGTGETLLVRSHGGPHAEAVLSVIPGGWEVRFSGGELGWRRLWARREESWIVYGAEPVADPRDPGVRTRWAFDLVTDLLALGRPGGAPHSSRV